MMRRTFCSSCCSIVNALTTVMPWIVSCMAPSTLLPTSTASRVTLRSRCDT
ncbi:hypothetical protein D3C87_2190690 [compost metagenome]